jgi:hypothetical protein
MLRFVDPFALELEPAHIEEERHGALRQKKLASRG